MKINNLIQLEPGEITEKFTKSSGPGGQHINKVDTKVELRFFVMRSPSLSKSVKDRLKVIAGNKWTLNGEIVITAEKYRSQSRNRELAKSKLISLILEALEKPVYRLKTRPSNVVRVRRSNEKQKRSKIKAMRSPVKDDQN
ncbi:MAG: alternative ribosome rescue aminoacyl-tRNA hydrolase ArfB [Paracoccaceae bacterium]